MATERVKQLSSARKQNLLVELYVCDLLRPLADERQLNHAPLF